MKDEGKNLARQHCLIYNYDGQDNCEKTKNSNLHCEQAFFDIVSNCKRISRLA